MDWLRWHHGSTTDPKFALVARKAGVRLPDVLAMWAHLLEAASSNEDRGSYGSLDFESIDFLFGFDDGQSKAIHDAMNARGLLADGRVKAWSKRQPKREREDDTAAERKRAQRERDKKKQQLTDDEAPIVTPRHATSRHVTPRGEEIREEALETPSLPERPKQPHTPRERVREAVADLRQAAIRAGYSPTAIRYADPMWDAAAGEGITPEQIGAVASEALSHPRQKPIGWVVTTARNRAADAREPVRRSGQGPPTAKPPSATLNAMNTLLAGTSYAPDLAQRHDPNGALEAPPATPRRLPA